MRKVLFTALVVMNFASAGDVQAVDTSAPYLLKAHYIAPETNQINSENGVTRVEVEFTAADDISGVCASCSEISIHNASRGHDIIGTITQTSGSDGIGVYRGVVDLPQYAHIVTYDLSLFLADYNDNQKNYSADLEAFLPYRSFDVVATVFEDGRAPDHLNHPTFSPVYINTDGGDQVVTISPMDFFSRDSGICIESDNCSRDSRIYHAPSGQQATITRTSGDASVGEYSAVITIPEGTATGYVPLQFQFYDALGNTGAWEYTDQIYNSGIATDVTSPVISNIVSITPSALSIDHTGARTFELIVDITDDIAGVCAEGDADCRADFSAEAGDLSEPDYSNHAIERISGDKLSGRYKLRFDAYESFAPGSYPIRLEVEDRLGNKLTYDVPVVHQVTIAGLTEEEIQSRLIYRFYSENYRSHFFTASAEERDHIIINDPNWTYEGEAYEASAAELADRSSVYRFYSAAYNSHFYTMSEVEKNYLIFNDSNWAYEGVAYYAYMTSGTDRTPLYRFYSENFRSHFYTSSEVEKKNLEENDPNWNYEGVAWYVND